MLPDISFFRLAGSLIYEKLGERAFGWPGKMAAFMAIIMQNIGGWVQTFSLSHICMHVCVFVQDTKHSSAPAAMSSYLFIVKYELPEVIRAFLALEENSG